MIPFIHLLDVTSFNSSIFILAMCILGFLSDYNSVKPLSQSDPLA